MRAKTAKEELEILEAYYFLTNRWNASAGSDKWTKKRAASVLGYTVAELEYLHKHHHPSLK